MHRTRQKALYEQARFLIGMRRDLERISGQLDASRVIRYALRRLADALSSDWAVQFDVDGSDGSLGPPWIDTPGGAASAPPPAETDRLLERCRRFLVRPLGPEDRMLLLLRLVPEDRPAAVLAFHRAKREFSRGDAHFAQEAAEILAENLLHRGRERAQAVRQRIYAKVLSEIRPKDVLYQILHGLKRLLQYDHGACIHLLEPDGSQLTIQAEIVAWTKAKSSRIGEGFAVTPSLKEWLQRTTHPVLLRAGDEGLQPGAIPECLLDLPGRSQQEPPVRALIVAVLRHRGRPLGCLQIRSRQAGIFAPSDLRTLDEFLPLASVTLYNSTLYKAQHDLLVTAERKTALADLARAISHDMNNALGVILPLLQTMRRDLADGTERPDQLARDLDVIEHYAESSARILKGLLSVAQGASEAARWSDLNAILESILWMLSANFEARHVQVERDLDPKLPRVYLRRGEIEQLFLNLIYNARDAMPDGGTIRIRTRGYGQEVEATVADTGCGIAPEIRDRIFEPFFTTKETGYGLGLDICRSIIWDYGGRMQIDSTPAEGTRVTVRIPLVGERLRVEAEALAAARSAASGTAATAADPA